MKFDSEEMENYNLQMESDEEGEGSYPSDS
jgi:hypothetical protein